MEDSCISILALSLAHQVTWIKSLFPGLLFQLQMVQKEVLADFSCLCCAPEADCCCYFPSFLLKITIPWTSLCPCVCCSPSRANRSAETLHKGSQYFREVRPPFWESRNNRKCLQAVELLVQWTQWSPDAHLGMPLSHSLPNEDCHECAK